MSRFGTTGTFYYSSGDTLSSGTYIYLNNGQMPQYPFETEYVTDRVTYRSKGGKSWMYQNYNLQGYTFKWSLLDETMKNSLKTMANSLPILAFSSNGTTWGTFRIADNSWKDQEAAYELFDVEMRIEETT